MHGNLNRAAIAALMLAGAGALPAMADDAFGGIRVDVNRHEFRGRCPAQLVFTGVIDFNMPHPRGFTMNYSWDRSDGGRGPVHVVRPGPNQRVLVVRENWRLGGRDQNYDVSVTLHVNSGNTHLRESSPRVHIECR